MNESSFMFHGRKQFSFLGELTLKCNDVMSINIPLKGRVHFEINF